MRYEYVRSDGRTVVLDTEERYSAFAVSSPRDVARGELGRAVVMPAMPTPSDTAAPRTALSVGAVPQLINTADRFRLDVVPYK